MFITHTCKTWGYKIIDPIFYFCGLIFVCGFASLPAHGMEIERELLTVPVITSFSTDFISVTSKDRYDTTFAIYGEDLGYLLEEGVDITLGPLVAHTVSGNSTGMNVTFTIDHSELKKRNIKYPINVLQADEVVATAASKIQVFNPYRGNYRKQKVKQFLKRTKKKHQRSKRTIGLNVHWALGGESTVDDRFAEKLNSSKTTWAREHFSYKLLMGDDSTAWWKRYDKTILRYDQSEMRVVGMLAYGAADNEFTPPAAREWKNFVRKVVYRYRNYVDVWEIWNEPDSSAYISNNHWKTYRPLLKHGSRIIRQYDKDAIVLNGAVSDISNTTYIRKLYKYGKPYFDELNVHVYYCEQYRDDGNSLGRLQQDWEQLRSVVSEYKANEKIWITELGCSTGTAGIDNKLVKQYIRAATKLLLSYDNTRPIFLYSFHDRTYLDAYEAYFGLLHEDFSNKPVWRWYRDLSKR